MMNWNIYFYYLEFSVISKIIILNLIDYANTSIELIISHLNYLSWVSSISYFIKRLFLAM